MEIKLLLREGVKERWSPMEKPKRELPITIVNVLVVIAILMILTALVVPVFIPPEGRAASQASAPSASSTRNE